MALQLDIATLVLMFITLALTSFLVMFLVWRINRDVPGVLCWVAATLFNTASAVGSLTQALTGGDSAWGPFLINSISLTANVLVVQGALLFRGYEFRRRWQSFLTLLPVLIILSWLSRHDPVLLDSVHLSFTMACQIMAGAVLIWGTARRSELEANMLAALSSICIGLLIGWQLWMLVNGDDMAGQRTEPLANQWYLFAGANLHVTWIFGLNVACYFRSRQQVMSLAREDALTSLPNRRWIDETLDQAFAEKRRTGEKFAVIMLDINQFKQVNDQYGHSAGDKVLKAVAERLKAAIRESDFAGRLGGDEFFVMVRNPEPDVPLNELIDRIRHQLNGKITLPGAGENIDIRVSIGAAVYPADGDHKDALLGAADASMYRDKARQAG
jgi:diguanylate cyclase (GGDEF)-like protein